MSHRVAILLQNTDISRTNRTALVLADALTARGHQVRLVTADEPLAWRGSRAEWVYVDDLRSYNTGDYAAVAATDLAARFPVVEEELYRERSPRENEPPRVLLSGASQDESKGIDDGYGAIAHARWFHQTLDLVRVSPWAPSREEPLDSVQEFHVALSTKEMTRLMHSCDALIAPNHREEGFGLPAAEALASGVPTVMTAIPSYLSFDEKQDYSVFAPEQNAVELGEKLIELLSDEDLRERLRVRGREVADQWRAEGVAERLEQFFKGRRS
jgi:glycosyltransferase involved in cell wall biosynthesis